MFNKSINRSEVYLGLGLCCYKLILDIFAFCALNDIMSSFFYMNMVYTLNYISILSHG